MSGLDLNNLDTDLDNDMPDGALHGANYVPPNANGSIPTSNHPTATFFHLFFKAAALFFYIFGTIFLDSFILVMT